MYVFNKLLNIFAELFAVSTVFAPMSRKQIGYNSLQCQSQVKYIFLLQYNCRKTAKEIMALRFFMNRLTFMKWQSLKKIYLSSLQECLLWSQKIQAAGNCSMKKQSHIKS